MRRAITLTLAVWLVSAALAYGVRAIYWYGFRQGQWHQHIIDQSAINDQQVRQFNEHCRSYPNYGVGSKGDI